MRKFTLIKPEESKQSSSEELLNNYSSLIKKICLRYDSEGRFLDDLYQTGVEELLRSHIEFNPNRGVYFYKFVTRRLENKILKQLHVLSRPVTISNSTFLRKSKAGILKTFITDDLLPELESDNKIFEEYLNNDSKECLYKPIIDNILEQIKDDLEIDDSKKESLNKKIKQILSDNKTHIYLSDEDKSILIKYIPENLFFNF